MSEWHSFSVDVACKVGVNAAIILGNIKHWCKKNKANGKHLHDGLYWSYNSIKAFSELYPYLGKGAIDNALKKLESGGYVKVGNYNKTAYDRTKWYAITADGLALFGEEPFTEDETHFTKQEIKEPQTGNPSGQKQEPIPDIDQLSTSSQPDITPTADEPPIVEIVAYLNEKSGHNYSPKAKGTIKAISKAWGLNPDKTSEERLAMFKKIVDNMCIRWIGTTMEQWLVPSTIFRECHFDDYLNAAAVPPKHDDKQQHAMKPKISEPRIGFMKTDNRTGKTEVYMGNGVWEEYVSDYAPQEGDVDIDF